jgi:hypothetical protein
MNNLTHDIQSEHGLDTDQTSFMANVAPRYLSMPVCEKTVAASLEYTLKRPAFNARLASVYRWLDQTGMDDYEWTLDQVYLGSTGALIGCDRKEIDRDTWFIDDIFGRDPARWFSEYKKRANGASKQRLHASCIERVMAMELAVNIYVERLKLTTKYRS